MTAWPQGNSDEEQKTALPVIENESPFFDENKNLGKDSIVYTARGGERLSFVARSLLGSPSKTKELESWNPGLKNGPLSAGTKVRVHISYLKPQAIYLSKDLIEKYPDILRSRMKIKGGSDYTTAKEDTLQKISQQHYKTTRQWTLLYLVNKKSITNPDQLKVGTVITIPAESN